MCKRPWDEPTDGAVTRYGFRWGPMLITRLAYVTRRGYALSIETPHQSMQVYVSEKGRKIKAYPVRPREDPTENRLRDEGDDKSAEDGQIDMEPDTLKATDADGE